MFKIKKILATLLAVAMMASIGSTVFASEVGGTEEGTVTYEYVFENGQPTPLINRQVTFNPTGYSENSATVDTPMFDENVTIKIDALSANISSVSVRLRYQVFTSTTHSKAITMYEGSTETFFAPSMNKYSVLVTVTGGNVSSTNPGTIVLTVSDK